MSSMSHFGSIATESGPPDYVRFTLGSDRRADFPDRQLRATSGSDAFLFDHLIGPDEQRRRHGNSDRASGVQVYGQFDPCWFLKW
jgi:hypothetical protein